MPKSKTKLREVFMIKPISCRFLLEQIMVIALSKMVTFLMKLFDKLFTTNKKDIINEDKGLTSQK